MTVLLGRRAIVTGGANGIGAAIAKAFNREGAEVSLLDKDEGAVDRVVRDIGASHTVHGFPADVTDADSLNGAVQAAVEAMGGIDVLVSAAGILDETPFEEMSEATFQRTIDIDLKGVFLAARIALPYLEMNGGRIINVSSQLGIKGGAGLVHYVAAKAGVIGMTKALALELAPKNILVNAIAPGPVNTTLVESLSDEWKRDKQAELPLGRFGEPEEIAPTAVLLTSSPGGDLYTGQTLGPNSGDVMP
ncbi:SDR family oxidoreductase [Kocuria koreensis]|jgi:3-oxoacyl-[acyl-carrier protein] reductase|uniref:SDR family oxidoreductase n=1 Tax=Rothia koreensis TaxID=592378 RepID=A0A7K1LH69_9MICC|nr:SDR family NAD(P)-dependent oxidoreductase [Rothia koreensis]MUN54539.1 SDR family oxidoreductase [Rothia koreensis]